MNGRCAVCGEYGSLDPHHIYGSSNRKKSTAFGYVIQVCRQCHDKIHFTDNELNLKLKRHFQRVFEKDHTREQFIAEFGKNYLD